MPRKPMNPDEFRCLIEKRQEEARSNHRRLHEEAFLFQEMQKLKEQHSIAMQDMHARYAEEFAELMAYWSSAHAQAEEVPIKAFPGTAQNPELHPTMYNAIQRLQKQVECMCRTWRDDSPTDRETNAHSLLEASDNLREVMGHPGRTWTFS